MYLARAGVKPANVNAWAPHFGAALQPEAFGKGVPEMTEFLAQVLHETGLLSTTTESLNYQVYALLNTFGKHRISEEQAKQFGRIDEQRNGKPVTIQAANQKAIANQVYGGAWGLKNLGNTEPTDGWDFRGSGLIQTTGRANFTYLKEKTGIDVLAFPDKLRLPSPDAVVLAIAQWKKLVKPEFVGDDVKVRRAVNGGTIGIEDCRVLKMKLQTIIV
jgi:putative chitinase